MSVHTHPLLALVWIVTIALHSYLAWIVCRDRERQSCFLLFVGFYVAINLALFGASAANDGQTYHYIYWISYPISVALVSIQAYRCFSNIFGPYRCMPPRFFHEFAASMFLLSVGMAALFVRYPSARIDGRLFTTMRTMEAWLCGVFLIISFLSDHYGIPWDTRSFGIAFGFLVRNALGIVCSLLYAHSPWFSTSSPRGLALIYGVHFATDAIVCTIWVAWYRKPSMKVFSISYTELQQLKLKA